MSCPRPALGSFFEESHTWGALPALGPQSGDVSGHGAGPPKRAGLGGGFTGGRATEGECLRPGGETDGDSWARASEVPQVEEGRVRSGPSLRSAGTERPTCRQSSPPELTQEFGESARPTPELTARGAQRTVEAASTAPA